MEKNIKLLEDVICEYINDAPKCEGYIVLINGKQFVSYRGKKVFAKKAHALSSLKQCLSSIKYYIANYNISIDGLDPKKDFWEIFFKVMDVRIIKLMPCEE